MRAYEAATQSHKCVRWIYACILVYRNPEVRRGLCRVLAILTRDNTGPLLVCVWGHTVDVLEPVLAGSYEKVGFVQLRLEQLSFSQLSKNSWGGDLVAPIYQGYAINIPGGSKRGWSRSGSGGCSRERTRRHAATCDLGLGVSIHALSF